MGPPYLVGQAPRLSHNLCSKQADTGGHPGRGMPNYQSPACVRLEELQISTYTVFVVK